MNRILKLSKTVALILVTILNTKLFGQKYTIKGIIENQGNQNIPGEVMVLDTDNGALIDMQTFNKGAFELQNITKPKVMLKLYPGGLKDTFFLIDNSELKQLVDVGTIQLNGIVQLQEVNVVARQSTFERTQDGLKVNVENTLLSRSANANELLSKVPTVNVAGNKVTVFGRGEAMIVLNGKEITYESFKSLSPTSIKNIEIITNPDSKYDSKAKAVIVVTMKRNYNQGTSIIVSNALTVGLRKGYAIDRYLMNAPNITLSFRKDKWDLTGYYANEYGTNFSQNDFITSVETTNGTFKKIGYYTEDNHNKSVHYYKLGLGYTFNKRSNFSVQYDGLSNDMRLNVNQNGDFYFGNDYVTKIRLYNNASTKLLNHSFNVNYNLDTDTLGSKLFIGAQYNQFRNQLFDRITESVSVDTNTYVNNRINNGLNEIELYTFQIDYTKKLKHGSFETGAKFSFTQNAGRIKFMSKAENEIDYIENNLFANATLYQEYVSAIYGIYRFKLKKLSGNLGLRYEHTNAKGISKKYNTTLINADYGMIFPSSKLNYKLSTNWNTSISYTNKISRPLYQDLDPFLWYLDSLTSIQGNSRLVPELVHQAEYKLNYKTFSIRYGFTLTKRNITSVMMQGFNGPNSVIFTKDNIQQRTLNSVAIDMPYEYKNYSTYNTIALNVYQYNDSRTQYKALSNSPQVYLYSYHSLKLDKLFTLELTGEYYGASFDGFTKRKPYYYFVIGLSRSFFKDESLNVGITWNDLAGTAVWGGKFSVNTYSNEYSQRFTTNYIRLNLTYTLLSKVSHNYQNKNVNEAEYNRIKK